MQRRRQAGEEAGDLDEEEDIEEVAARLNNMRIETAGSEDEAPEQMEAVL